MLLFYLRTIHTFYFQPLRHTFDWQILLFSFCRRWKATYELVSSEVGDAQVLGPWTAEPGCEESLQAASRSWSLSWALKSDLEWTRQQMAEKEVGTQVTLRHVANQLWARSCGKARASWCCGWAWCWAAKQSGEGFLWNCKNWVFPSIWTILSLELTERMVGDHLEELDRDWRGRISQFP